MIKVYCGKLYPDKRYLEILNPNFGFRKRKNIFDDRDIFDDFINPIFEIEEDPDLADFLLIPHNYFFIQDNKQYIRDFIDLSNKYSKKIIVFAIGDSTRYIDIPNSVILRTSQYLSKKRSNEIIIPAYATDLSYGKEILYRNKADIPIIGFCGWAETNGLLAKLIFWYKNTFILDGPYRLGLFFRKKVIEILARSRLLKTNFIIRKSYSANKNTIGLDPIIARKEYIKNMIESDFILTPKGDGNYSVRFYEALSLGRIPILIDTECPLPLDKDIDYNKFILRVSYKDIDNLDNIISDFYNRLSNDEWIEMQKTARAMFDQYLRIDVFFRYIFTKENLDKYTLNS